MGGFTSIQLKDTSQENIDEQNAELDALGVAKRYRFYSEKNIRLEWDYYQACGPELRAERFPAHSFPQDITSYETFTQHWSPKKWGTCFIPEIGMLTFDACFGRTSTRAMHGIARFLLYSFDGTVKETTGSYSTFVERCGYKAKTKIKILMELE